MELFSTAIADIIFVLIGVFTVINASKRGFFKTLFHFFRFILAAVATYLWGDWVASLLEESFDIPVFVGYIGAFLIALLILRIVESLVSHLIESSKIIEKLDTLLGTLLGVVLALTWMLLLSSLVKYLFADTTFYIDTVVIRFFGDSALLEHLGFLDFGQELFDLQLDDFTMYF